MDMNEAFKLLGETMGATAQQIEQLQEWFETPTEENKLIERLNAGFARRKG